MFVGGLVTFLAVAAFAYQVHGVPGVLASAVAVSICFAAAAISVPIVIFTRPGPSAVQGLLLGMLLRMALPMVVGLALDRRGGPLAEAGVFGLIVVSYLVFLAMETILSLRLVQTGAGGAS